MERMPSVHVVLVSHEPGLWLEEVLESVAAQDLVPAAVTVVDADNESNLADRVQSVLPQAEVRQMDSATGFGQAVNSAILGPASANKTAAEISLIPDFYVFCHDDVSLSPSTLRVLVSEAVTSNVGVVGPKYVDWDDPARIRHLGFVVDKTGAFIPAVEPGEYDQEQHDHVQEVFAVGGGCVLVRGDLFHAAEGFDSEIVHSYEHIDLCWRARTMGARVVVAPAAIVRHRQQRAQRLNYNQIERLNRRYQLRTVLSAYGLWHAWRIVPQVILIWLIEGAVALGSGRFHKVYNMTAAWGHTLWHLSSIRQKRQLLARNRNVSDAVVRTAQHHRSIAVETVLRDRRLGGTSAVVARVSQSQLAIMVTLATLLFVAIGARNLFSDGIAAVGGLAEFGSSADLLDSWWSRERAVGLGQEGFAPSGLGLLTVLSWLFFGQTGLLRTVLIVGMVPLGAAGMWRCTRSFGSHWVQGLSVAVYLANPVPYNALANGVWGGLLLYGAAPWLLAVMFQPNRNWLRCVLTFGVLLGLVGALAADAVVGVGLLLIGVLVGSLLAANTQGTGRMLAIALAGAAVAVVLNLPWLFEGVPQLLTASSTGGWGYSWAEILRFDTGPFGGNRVGWALPVAATLPLLLAEESRLAWAVRGWVLYLGTAALALIAEHQWLSIPLPRLEVIQAPGAVGLALAAAMGLAAFQIDLRQHRFGWRQLVLLSAVAALVMAMLPAVGMVAAGTWNATEEAYENTYPFSEANQLASEGNQRVLWLGHPDLLPLGSWELTDGLWFAVSDSDEFPTVEQRWVGGLDDVTRQVGKVLLAAPSDGSKRLGAVLADWDIDTVLVIERLAPAPYGHLYRAAPAWLIATLDGQLDLIPISLTSKTITYRNIAYSDAATTLGPTTLQQGIDAG